MDGKNSFTAGPWRQGWVADNRQTRGFTPGQRAAVEEWESRQVYGNIQEGDGFLRRVVVGRFDRAEDARLAAQAPAMFRLLVDLVASLDPLAPPEVLEDIAGRYVTEDMTTTTEVRSAVFTQVLRVLALAGGGAQAVASTRAEPLPPLAVREANPAPVARVMQWWAGGGHVQWTGQPLTDGAELYAGPPTLSAEGERQADALLALVDTLRIQLDDAGEAATLVQDHLGSRDTARAMGEEYLWDRCETVRQAGAKAAEHLARAVPCPVCQAQAGAGCVSVEAGSEGAPSSCHLGRLSERAGQGEATSGEQVDGALLEELRMSVDAWQRIIQRFDRGHPLPDVARLAYTHATARHRAGLALLDAATAPATSVAGGPLPPMQPDGAAPGGTPAG